MGRGRALGYVVTHAATRTVGEVYHPVTRRLIQEALVRCTCGRPFRGDLLILAQAAHGEHLDRMEAKGRPVRRG